MGCCTTDPKMDENELYVAQQKRMNKGMKITDMDAWSYVLDLWKKHGLNKEEAIKFDEAKPFIQ